MKKLRAALKAWYERMDDNTGAIYFIPSVEGTRYTGGARPTKQDVERDIATLLLAAGIKRGKA